MAAEADAREEINEQWEFRYLSSTTQEVATGADPAQLAST